MGEDVEGISWWDSLTWDDGVGDRIRGNGLDPTRKGINEKSIRERVAMQERRDHI
jgi:hypothetical protein